MFSLSKKSSARARFVDGVCKQTKVGAEWLQGLCVGEGMFWWAPIG